MAFSAYVHLAQVVDLSVIVHTVRVFEVAVLAVFALAAVIVVGVRCTVAVSTEEAAVVPFDVLNELLRGVMAGFF